MIPYSRPKLSDLYTLSQNKLFQIYLGTQVKFFFKFFLSHLHMHAGGELFCSS